MGKAVFFLLVIIFLILAYLIGYYIAKYLYKPFYRPVVSLEKAFDKIKMDNQKKGFNLGEYLNSKGYIKIGIYGKGRYLEELQQECCGCGLDFKFLADRDSSQCDNFNMPVITPRELCEKDLDLIIVTSLAHGLEMKQLLIENNVQCRVYTYYELEYNLKRYFTGSKKMVAISTWPGKYSLNYGSILQTCALQNVIKEEGYEPFTILLDADPHICRIDVIKKYINLGIRYLATFRKFGYFYNNNVYSSKYCNNDSQIVDQIIENRCNIFLSGADSIWSDHFMQNVHVWNYKLVDWFPKIAYAPSMEMSGYKGKNIKQIEKFMVIGAREYTMERYLKEASDSEEFINSNINVVIDPTLLVNENYWDDKASRRIIKDSYILCYLLTNPEKCLEYVEDIKSRYKSKKVCFIRTELIDNNWGKRTTSYSNNNINKIVGPSDFLSLIKYADAVVTDSYHGALLSIRFKRQFYTMFRRYRMYDPRFDTVYLKLGIVNRRVEDYDSIYDMKDIDYDIVDVNLTKERKKSRAFLHYALMLADLESE